MLKRREESDTYLTHICRHYSSRESPEKKITYEELSENTVAFIRYRLRCSLYLQPMKATVLAESSSYFFFFLLWAISATTMSTDVSRVGVALFSSF
jgi:hypothetical protein